MANSDTHHNLEPLRSFVIGHINDWGEPVEKIIDLVGQSKRLFIIVGHEVYPAEDYLRQHPNRSPQDGIPGEKYEPCNDVLESLLANNNTCGNEAPFLVALEYPDVGNNRREKGTHYFEFGGKYFLSLKYSSGAVASLFRDVVAFRPFCCFLHCGDPQHLEGKFRRPPACMIEVFDGDGYLVILDDRASRRAD